jgi:hypothetical protein
MADFVLLAAISIARVRAVLNLPQKSEMAKVE